MARYCMLYIPDGANPRLWLLAAADPASEASETSPEQRRGQDRTGQDRTGQDRTGQDRTGQDRT